MAIDRNDVPTYLIIGKVITYATYAFVVFAEIVLLFRIFFILFSANPSTPFVQFIYNTSADFLAPFRGIFPTKPVGELGYLDISALFALIVYLLLGWGVQHLISYIQRKITESAEPTTTTARKRS